MIFNSIDFAIFLPIVFILYWFVTQKNLKAQTESLAEKERQLDERIIALDNLLNSKSSELEQRISDKTSADRKSLGAMLLSMGQQLKAD